MLPAVATPEPSADAVPAEAPYYALRDAMAKCDADREPVFTRAEAEAMSAAVKDRMRLTRLLSTFVAMQNGGTAIIPKPFVQSLPPSQLMVDDHGDPNVIVMQCLVFDANGVAQVLTVNTHGAARAEPEPKRNLILLPS